MNSSRINSQMLESNTLAIIDSSGVRDARDVHEDRLSFLEAVRTASLRSASPIPPTWKMFDAIFHILRDSNSLELATASFQLLTDLDKGHFLLQRYPRVYLDQSDSLGTDSSGGGQLIVNKEAWSPFTVGSENFYSEATTSSRDSKSLLDSEYFSILVEEIMLSRHFPIKIVENMLLFQYLVHVLEVDYLPRQTSYKRTLNWAVLRESIFGMLLASRKMNYKSLVRNCMTITSRSFLHGTNICLKDLKEAENTSADLPQSCNVGLSFAFPEFLRTTCDAAQKFLILIMELDLIRKDAEKCGCTSRLDSFRVPILDTIIDVLTYNKDQISPFLEVFGEPKWKLEMILLYFGKYCKRPTTRTRRTCDLPNDETFQGILNCFSNPTISCGILKKISSVVARFLLAQAFKCYLSLQNHPKNAVFLATKVGGSTLPQICSSLIASFINLRQLDELD
ncbi:hypothetical protein KSP40_PGU017345 [Platanthera guangdongensis]|uniref:Negative regulator of systemic acquired resistance SNI1 n=1 Tax=Platanthera guangdongensis TaxID=2320717 RepID=A0ABR2N1V7_9ASPA